MSQSCKQLSRTFSKPNQTNPMTPCASFPLFCTQCPRSRGHKSKGKKRPDYNSFQAAGRAGRGRFLEGFGKKGFPTVTQDLLGTSQQGRVWTPMGGSHISHSSHRSRCMKHTLSSKENIRHSVYLAGIGHSAAVWF